MLLAISSPSVCGRSSMVVLLTDGEDRGVVRVIANSPAQGIGLACSASFPIARTASANCLLHSAFKVALIETLSPLHAAGRFAIDQVVNKTDQHAAAGDVARMTGNRLPANPATVTGGTLAPTPSACSNIASGKNTCWQCCAQSQRQRKQRSETRWRPPCRSRCDRQRHPHRHADQHVASSHRGKTRSRMASAAWLPQWSPLARRSHRCSFPDAATDRPAARVRLLTRLPTLTMAQLRNTSRVEIRPSAQAITSKLLPVNSSAPATITSSKPSENTTP